LWGCRDEYYAWGLLQIAKAVSFLNNDCKLVSILELNMVFFSLVVFFLYQFFFLQTLSIAGSWQCLLG